MFSQNQNNHLLASEAHAMTKMCLFFIQFHRQTNSVLILCFAIRLRLCLCNSSGRGQGRRRLISFSRVFHASPACTTAHWALVCVKSARW